MYIHILQSKSVVFFYHDVDTAYDRTLSVDERWRVAKLRHNQTLETSVHHMSETSKELVTNPAYTATSATRGRTCDFSQKPYASRKKNIADSHAQTTTGTVINISLRWGSICYTRTNIPLLGKNITLSPGMIGGCYTFGRWMVSMGGLDRLFDRLSVWPLDRQERWGSRLVLTIIYDQEVRCHLMHDQCSQLLKILVRGCVLFDLL